MPCLVVVRWRPQDSEMPGGYGDLDVIQVLDADQDPGTRVVANDPPRFGFFYVSDRDVDDPAIARFMEPETTGTEGTPSFSLVRKRRWQGVRANIPGDASRFLTYHPWNGDGSSVPANVQFTAANVAAFLRDRLA